MRDGDAALPKSLWRGLGEFGGWTVVATVFSTGI